jgi:hypothetical protein
MRSMVAKKRQAIRSPSLRLGPVILSVGLAFIAAIAIVRLLVLRDLGMDVATMIRDKASAMQLSSQIRDRHGEPIGVFSDETRYVVALSDIPQSVRNAFLAAEDASFFRHFGISPAGMLRAIVANLRRERFAQGGSTITQQLVRQLLLGREKTVVRKVREIILAVELERRMSKSQILEMWLNCVYLGNNAWGVETAAQQYFGKHVQDLSTAEAAVLAGLPQAPSRYAPHLNPRLARKRQLYVLKRLRDLQWVGPSEYDNARLEKVRTDHFRVASSDQAPWVSETVLLELWRGLEQKLLPRTGLIINTSIDRSWQTSLQSLINKNFGEIRKFGLEVAAVVLDTKSGETRALVGGSDFKRNQFNRATDLYRPVGASIYPLVFAWAVEQGIMSIDGYSSLAEAAVKTRFAEAEQLAPEMGYGLVREKLMGLGYVVKDAMAIDEMHGSPLSLARSYLSLTSSSQGQIRGLISEVRSGGRVIFSVNGGAQSNMSQNSMVGSTRQHSGLVWVIRQWMSIGSATDKHALAHQPVLKSIKGWNAWWIIPRDDVVIAAWVGADQREPRSPSDFRAADATMDASLANWIATNLPGRSGFGVIPEGISYQLTPSKDPNSSVRLPFLISGHGTF